LLTTFSVQALLIANDQFKDRDISSLYMKIQRMVKTATKLSLVSDFMFDGLVPMAFGQANTVLQYALRWSDLYCAKIGDSALINTEAVMARRIHENQRCPSVMPVIDTVDLSKGRLALITPLYTMPLSYMQVQETTVVNMALCTLATIKAFFNKNICHGDLKPSNMMFQAGNRIVVTIDFGSCANYGEPLPSTSPIFGMDCPIEGSLQYDLTCLATSIVFLLGNKLDQFNSRAEISQWLTNRQGTHYTIAALCLEPDVTVDTIWTKCQQLGEIMHSYSNWIVDLNEIWPVQL
jgi:hypothetical protein